MVENLSSKGLKDCPFRTGNCIASDCMIWIGKHNSELNEEVGHCAIVKTHRGIYGVETALTCIVTLLALITIMMIMIVF